MKYLFKGAVKMRPMFVLLLVVISLIFPKAAVAIELREELVSRINTLVDSCYGSGTYNKKFIPTDISAHQSGSEKNYIHIPNVSFERLATFTYSPAGKLNEAVGGGGNRFIQTPIAKQDVRGASGFTNLQFVFTCTSAMNMAMNAHFDPNPLLFWERVDISAGIKADANNSANSGLVMLYGRFESPLGRLIADQTDKMNRIKGYSAIWRASSANSLGVSILDYFEGWLIKSTNASTATQSLSANANANLHLMMLNADWSTQAELKYSADFARESFDAYIVNWNDEGIIKPNYGLYKTPGIKEISDAVKSVATIAPSTAEVVSGQPAQYTVSIPGIESDLCINEWAADVAAPAAINAVTSSYDDRQGVCLVNIAVQIQDPLPVQSKNQTISVFNTGHLINGAQVKFDVSTKFHKATYPVFALATAPIPLVTEGRNVQLAIDSQINTVPSPGLSISSVVVTDAELKCDPDPAKLGFSALNKTYDVSKNTLHTVFEFPNRAAFPSTSCTWKAYVDFKHGPNSIIKTPLEYNIDLTPSLLPPKQL